MIQCLVTGGTGQVGLALREQPAPRDLSLVFPERGQLDLADRNSVTEAFSALAPGMVINAAAYTDVDGAESDPEAAFAVNRDGPAYLAEACDKTGIPLIHLSTDFVFDGTAGHPYKEDDPVSPLSVYGESKAEGEATVRDRLENHIIVRTAWVFGPHRSNFVKSILLNAAEKPELRVVDDQVGGPTEASDIAGTLLSISASLPEGGGEWGTFHYSGVPAVSRFDLAAGILDRARPHLGQIPRLTPISSTEHPSPAKRPGCTILDCGRIYRVFGIEQPDWRPALSRIIESCVGDIA